VGKGVSRLDKDRRIRAPGAFPPSALLTLQNRWSIVILGKQENLEVIYAYSQYGSLRILTHDRELSRVREPASWLQPRSDAARGGT
jgi:hypothetical protein